MGCSYAFNSEGNKNNVQCNYTPGLYYGQVAFDKDAYCKMANWSENKEAYGELHWCGTPGFGKF